MLVYISQEHCKFKGKNVFQSCALCPGLCSVYSTFMNVGYGFINILSKNQQEVHLKCDSTNLCGIIFKMWPHANHLD